MPDRVDPVRAARAAAGTRRCQARQGCRGWLRRRAPLRARPRRRRRRVRRVLPAARRARGLWAATRPGGHDAASARDVAGGGGSGGGARGGDGRRRVRRPAVTAPHTEGYYGRPIVKPPVWKQEIGWYLFTGGLAGASSTLALGARMAGNERLARSSTLLATAGLMVSPALLVKDLGRPERFLNMLRV